MVLVLAFALGVTVMGLGMYVYYTISRFRRLKRTLHKIVINMSTLEANTDVVHRQALSVSDELRRLYPRLETLERDATDMEVLTRDRELNRPAGQIAPLPSPLQMSPSSVWQHLMEEINDA